MTLATSIGRLKLIFFRAKEQSACRKLNKLWDDAGMPISGHVNSRRTRSYGRAVKKRRAALIEALKSKYATV